jgi:hypothetical protein
MMGEGEEAQAAAAFAISLARQEERRRQGALLVLRECCQRAGEAVEALRRAEREDAAVMPTVPTIPRANTNLACIMIGERVAGWLRATGDD